MPAVFLAALWVGLTLLVLLAGYMWGRSEADAYYESIITELEETIDVLLPSSVRIIP